MVESSRIARGGRAWAVGMLVLLIFGVSGVLTAQAADDRDSQGTEFWLAFMENYVGSEQLTLFITGPVDTTGTVEIPGLAFSEAFSVTADDVTTVNLPIAAMLSGQGVADKAVHVTAADEITVYGLNRRQATTDAFLALPVDALGTDHRAVSFRGGSLPDQVAVVATADDTTVTVTPPGGAPTSETIDAGQAYQFQHPGELTGASITADKPVSVFSGNTCANIPAGYGYCDHIVEQVPPTEAWGTRFVSMPLATRTGGDTFRILVAEDGTDVTINGATVATLDAGEFHTELLTGPATIGTTGPALVAQFSNGTTFDGVTSDPFMMLIPPYEQFLANYTVSTPATGFGSNFVNVVAPDAAIGDITLDGTPIEPSEFTAIGDGFSGAQVPVDLGAHTLDGSLPFGVFSYGFDHVDSYGYPGGASYSPIAVVSDLTLTPAEETLATGETGCVTATVSDQDGAPVEGVRVDFDVTGANPGAGFGSTDPNGEVDHCWTGENGGSDTVEASIGALSATATKTWSVCAEDGLQVLGDAGVASGVVHDAVEPLVAPLAPTVHDLNCSVVVPVEDAVDGLVG